MLGVRRKERGELGGGGSRSSYTKGEYQGKAGCGPHTTYSLTPFLNTLLCHVAVKVSPLALLVC